MKKTSVILLLTSVMSQGAWSQQTITLQDQVKRIEVNGSAETEVVPDEIYVGFTLQEYYNKQKVKEDINGISRNFLASCEKAGIAKDYIEVQNMSGFDNTSWWYRKRKKEQPDLLQSTTYVIKFSTPAEVDKLVNLLDDNATQNVYISKTSSSKEKEFRRQLKIQALQNAKAKATYLLEGIGAKAGQVLFVREVEVNDVPVYKVYERAAMAPMMDANSSANEGINFHKIKYRFDVEAHFAIE